MYPLPRLTAIRPTHPFRYACDVCSLLQVQWRELQPASRKHGQPLRVTDSTVLEQLWTVQPNTTAIAPRPVHFAEFVRVWRRWLSARWWEQRMVYSFLLYNTYLCVNSVTWWQSAKCRNTTRTSAGERPWRSAELTYTHTGCNGIDPALSDAALPLLLSPPPLPLPLPLPLPPPLLAAATRDDAPSQAPRSASTWSGQPPRAIFAATSVMRSCGARACQ